MRQLTTRDALATLIVAAVVTPFVVYSVRGTTWFLEDPRGMAGVGLVGGVLALLALGRSAFGAGAFRDVMTMLAVVSLGFGVAALVAETTWFLLVPMVAALLVFWALAVVHDAGYLPTHRIQTHS